MFFKKKLKVEEFNSVKVLNIEVLKTENYARHHECETSRAHSEVRLCIVWSQCMDGFNYIFHVFVGDPGA